MEPVSQKFLDALRSSHRVFSYMDVVGPDQQSLRLQITDGEVQVDRTAAVRRRCSCKVVDPTGQLTPTRAGDLLTPYGTMLFPYRGIIFSDGTTEVVSLGTFRVSDSDITDDNGKLEISLEAYDLSRTVARDKFTAPYTIPKGTNISSAIAAIVRRTFPAVEVRTSTTWRSVESQLVVDTDGDPWKTCQDLAQSAGSECYFDIRGQLVIAPVPDPANLPSPDFEYIEGEECVMLSLERAFSDEDAHNGVVVIGEAPDDTGDDNTDPQEQKPPVRAVVWDEDPRSVTYHRGPYGEYPMFINDDTVKSIPEAAMVAKAKLSEILGFVTKVGVSVLPNPAFDGGDTIRIVRSRLGVDDKFLLDGFNVPLTADGEQTLEVRQKRRR